MSPLSTLLQELSATPARLVAVSKTHPVAAIQAFYDEGQRLFGENRVQELVPKYEALPKDIEWHLIGHLQTNKVKYIAPFVGMIQSIDSEKLLHEVNKQAERCGRVIPCLLQVKIAEEDTKYGLSAAEVRAMAAQDLAATYPHVRIDGLMGMATFTDDQTQVRREFERLKALFDELKAAHFAAVPHFKEISMGMSDDYPLAVEVGSTLVRVGSKLFGARDYSL